MKGNHLPYPIIFAVHAGPTATRTFHKMLCMDLLRPRSPRQW